MQCAEVMERGVPDHRGAGRLRTRRKQSSDV
jgi:hypothetical protein